MTEQQVYEIIAEKYRPSDEARLRVLSQGSGQRLRFASHNPPRLELNIHFERRQDAELLYRIEDDLCALCGAYSFRIFPHYPPSEFTLSAMEEIFSEASKIGAVVSGYFY